MENLLLAKEGVEDEDLNNQVETTEQVSHEEIDLALRLRNNVPNLYSVVEVKDEDNNVDVDTSKGQDGGQVGRMLKFDFIETGMAYNEESKSTLRVQSMIPLDIIKKPDICEFVRVPRVYEGISYIGYYNVEFTYSIPTNDRNVGDDGITTAQSDTDGDEDGDTDDEEKISSDKCGEKTCGIKTYQILIPGERTYDPAGIENDLHCGLAIGNACSMTQTAILTTMIKALKEGATYESIRDMHLEHLNPLISKYHGRIPLSMWILHQLKCVFAKDPTKKRPPITYAHFILNTLKRRQKRYNPTLSVDDIIDDVSMENGEDAGEIRKKLENLEQGNDIDDNNDENINNNDDAIYVDVANCEYDLTGKFLCPYIEWSDINNSTIIVDTEKKMLHLKKYLSSYLLGQAVPPLEYFESIYKKMRKLLDYKEAMRKEKKRLIVEAESNKHASNENMNKNKNSGISTNSILTAVVGFFTSDNLTNKPSLDQKMVKISSGLISNKQRLKQRSDDSLKQDPLLPYVINKNLIPLARTMGNHFIQVCNDSNVEKSTEHAKTIMEHWALVLDPYKLVEKATDRSKKTMKSHIIGWRYIDIPIYTNLRNNHALIPKGIQSRVFGHQMVNVLIYAIFKRRKKIVETILTQSFRDSNGFLVKIAAPNCRDANGWTPLMYAALWGDVDVVTWLLNYRQGWMEHEIGTLNDPIHDNAVLLLDVHGSLQSYDGVTALMLACYHGHHDVVEQLLDYDDSLQNVFGRVHLRELGFFKGATVGHIVCGMKDQHADILKLLLRNKKYVGTKDIAGNTPLHYAARLGHVNLIELLIAMDAAVTATNNLGQTPLMLAATSSCSLSSVTILLKWGAIVNKRDHNGKSPLHYAFEAYKEILMVQRMVRGADLVSKFWRNIVLLQKSRRNSNATKGLKTLKGQLDASKSDDKNLMRRDTSSKGLYKYGGGQILVYTQDNCVFCNKVFQKFNDKEVPFVEVNISKYPDRQSTMLGDSIPEIWFNDTLIGGLSDLEDLEIDGKLEDLLRSCVSTPPPPTAPMPIKANQNIIATREKVYKLQQLLVKLDINATIETFERRSALQDGIIHLLLSKDGDLDALSNAGKEPFDDELKQLWLATVRPQLIESSERTDGWNDQCWSYKRTQRAVNMEWIKVAKFRRMRMSFFWLLLCLSLFYTTLKRFGFDNTNARLLHDGLVARFMGKPYDYSEQPNKRFMDSDTRQDFYNFFRGALLPGLYDPDSFWARDTVSLPSQHGAVVPSNGHVPCVRHLKLVGVMRLRQLRVKCAACSKHGIKGTYPNPSGNIKSSNGSSSSSGSSHINCCFPSFIAGDTENKETFYGPFSKNGYRWSEAKFVPSVYGSENLHQYHGGGYITLFPTNATASHELILQLERDNWIDLNTRAVIAEFVVVNEQEKLLGSVTLIVEFFSAGSIKPSYIVRVWRQSFDGLLSVGSLIVFLTLYLYFLLNLIIEELWKNWRDESEKAFICDFGNVIGERKEYHYYQTKTRKQLFGWRPTGVYGGGFYRIPVTEESKWETEKPDDKARITLFGYSFRIPRGIYMLGTSLRKFNKTLSMVMLTLMIIERIRIEIKLSTIISEQQQVDNHLGTEFPEKHVDLNHHTSFYTKLVSICMITCAVRLLNLFDWLPSVARMSLIIFQQLDKLRYFLLVFLIVLLMYGAFGLFSIGVEVGEEFGTIGKSVIAMYGGITTQGFQYLTMERAAPVLSPIIFVFVLTTGVILILNLLIAFMTEGYQAVIDLASETWAYSQFQQITNKEHGWYRLQRKPFSAVNKTDNKPGLSTTAPTSSADNDTFSNDKYSHEINAAAFKQDINLCELARRNGQSYTVSSKIGKLLMLWYQSTKRTRRKRRYYRQKRRTKKH